MIDEIIDSTFEDNLSNEDWEQNLAEQASQYNVTVDELVNGNESPKLSDETMAEMDEYYKSHPEITTEVEYLGDNRPHYTVLANGKLLVEKVNNKSTVNAIERIAKAGEFNSKEIEPGYFITMSRHLNQSIETLEDLETRFTDYVKNGYPSARNGRRMISPDQKKRDQQGLNQIRTALRVKKYEDEIEKINESLPNVAPPF